MTRKKSFSHLFVYTGSEIIALTNEHRHVGWSGEFQAHLKYTIVQSVV
ncbi:MAG TPA: hypothetical protein VF095_05420 [Bacillota bacterium]